MRCAFVTRETLEGGKGRQDEEESQRARLQFFPESIEGTVGKTGKTCPAGTNKGVEQVQARGNGQRRGMRAGSLLGDVQSREGGREEGDPDG